MKKIKYLVFLVMALFMSVSFTACSDDDDESDSSVPTYADYYIECTSVIGGGLSAQECTSLQTDYNSIFSNLTMSAMERNEAIEEFDALMQNFAKRVANIRPNETLRILFALKTSQGATVKTATITISKEGASVSRASGYTITIE